MASPQIEDGYTKIADELLEALARTRIPGEAMQILLTIFRKTYGFNKKSDAISLSQFHLATGIHKPNICRSLNQLIAINMIIKKENVATTEYRINKDYSLWKPLSKKRTLSEVIMPVLGKEKKRSQKRDIQKRKETLTKDKRIKESFISLFSDDFQKDEKFKATWLDWIKHRKEIRKKLTETTASRQADKLMQYDLITAISMIEQSIEKGWTGLFEIKEGFSGKDMSEAQALEEMKKMEESF